MVVLPINDNPPIKSYLHRAYTSGVISTRGSEATKWLRSVFLQLYFDCNEQSYKMDFYPIPFYRYECLDDGHIKGCILNSENILEISKQLINSGYYLSFVVDEYYIEKTSSYKKRHFNHWLMAYGYDEQGLYCIGYLSNKHYKKFKIEYSVLVESVKYADGIGVYKVVEDFEFFYDFEMAKELIFDYITSANTSIKHKIYKRPNHAVYGLDVYEAMIDDLSCSYDYRYAHVLLEHKENVRYWLVMCGFGEDLIQEYNKIIKQCRLLEFLYLKQNSDFSENTKMEIINLLRNIKKQEEAILTACYEQLKKKND